MSIYYAIEFDSETKNYIYQYQTILKQNSVSGDFSDKESFHITVLYVGNDIKDRKSYMEVLDKLKEKFNPKPFEIYLQNFNFFDNNGDSEGKIAWIGVKNSFPLYQLKYNIESIIKEMDLYVEPNRFNGYIPHITMGYNVVMSNTLNTVFVDDKPIKIKSICLWDSFKANDTYITNKIYEVFFDNK